MFRKTLTLHALVSVLLLGSAATHTSCTSNHKKEVSAESDQAYNDFKTFVADVEAKADAAANETEADYERETAQLKTDFDARVAAVDKYADQFDDARRQEIEALRTRYTTAYDKREMTWKNRPGATASADGAAATTAGSMASAEGDASAAGSASTGKLGKYYKPTSPAAAMTAANARGTYEAFVRSIKQNEDKFDIDDWRNINAEWRAMDAKYDQIKGDVSGKDKAEIAKEKLKYAAFKSFDKTEARGAQVGDLVTGKKAEAEAKGEGVQVERSGKNALSDVKEAGKEVGQGAAKVGKKVGGAVKDVFDGKDNKKE